MPLIEWKFEYDTGIRHIDIQHQKLVGITNRLHDAMQNGEGYNILETISQELIEYTIQHFSQEEKLMKIFEYPHIEEHIKQHKMLTDELSKIHEGIKQNKLPLAPLKMKEFLLAWITKHIIETDLHYVAFVGKEENTPVTRNLIDNFKEE
ncbi:hemerythrin family protein [bacterium]|nr:hemerythrin family protein [bacterium]